MAELSDQGMIRYNQQIILRGFNSRGQETLKDAWVLVVSLGRLGRAATQYLVGAGVGYSTPFDSDAVSVSNLQRQALRSNTTVGQSEVLSVHDALARINPYVVITSMSVLLEENQIHALITEHDLALDCMDNVSVRNQLDAGCFAVKVPLVSGTAIRMEGQTTVFTYQEGEPCYRCLSRLFGENVLTRIEAGVMTPLIDVAGSLQAMEIVKLLTNYDEPASEKIVMYGTMTCQFCEIRLMRNLRYEVCGQ